MHLVELVSIGKANAEIIEFHVEEDADVVGLSLSTINFPKGTLINAIIRKDQLVTPTGDTTYKKMISYIF
ncbi:TrkA C-terminal domain-containing protein [Sutcliffiella cohnii]